MYQEYYGLTGKPFQLSPDANFFYPSSEHKRALSFLDYGLDQQDGFIVITGDVGTGKTTLVQMLLRRLDPRETLVANLVTTQVGDDDLLQLIAAQFGLRVNNASKAVLLRELERLFLQQRREGRRVLLIVDEAQNLPAAAIEELRMLSNFQAGGKPLLQVFLLGQEEFRVTLLGPGFEQLRQRVIATYHLNPLDEAETRAYIEYRLSLVGWANDPFFTDDAYAAIYGFCKGVPRRLNNLCDRLLLYAFLEELHHIDGSVVDAVSREIGAEFWGETPTASKEPRAVTPEVFDTPGQPLETMARVMFDKANVQQRLAALERAIDGLGQSLKPELAELREELGYVRNLMEDLVLEIRHAQNGARVSDEDINALMKVSGQEWR
ncbi:MAG: XrtA-associated ATPase [Pseudomonadales bacterium]|nr:XrtA-associated ATPase [Pseudomonadales bacterium]